MLQHMSRRPCVCPPYLPTSHPVAICIPQEVEFISLLFPAPSLSEDIWMALNQLVFED